MISKNWESLTFGHPMASNSPLPRHACLFRSAWGRPSPSFDQWFWDVDLLDIIGYYRIFNRYVRMYFPNFSLAFPQHLAALEFAKFDRFRGKFCGLPISIHSFIISLSVYLPIFSWRLHPRSWGQLRVSCRPGTVRPALLLLCPFSGPNALGTTGWSMVVHVGGFHKWGIPNSWMVYNGQS